MTKMLPPPSRFRHPFGTIYLSRSSDVLQRPPRRRAQFAGFHQTVRSISGDRSGLSGLGSQGIQPHFANSKRAEVLKRQVGPGVKREVTSRENRSSPGRYRRADPKGAAAQGDPVLKLVAAPCGWFRKTMCSGQARQTGTKPAPRRL